MHKIINVWGNSLKYLYGYQNVPFPGAFSLGKDHTFSKIAKEKPTLLETISQKFSKFHEFFYARDIGAWNPN